MDCCVFRLTIMCCTLLLFHHMPHTRAICGSIFSAWIRSKLCVYLLTWACTSYIILFHGTFLTSLACIAADMTHIRAISFKSGLHWKLLQQNLFIPDSSEGHDVVSFRLIRHTASPPQLYPHWVNILSYNPGKAKRPVCDSTNKLT